MKSNWKDVETEQSNYRKGAHRVRNWWMIPVVAMLALPAPAWSQFKEPELTDLTANRGLEWGATLSSDMLEAYWVVSEGNNQWDVWEAHRESIDASWEDPEPLDVVNTGNLESSPHLSNNGLTLTFAANGRDGGYGGLDLWQTYRASRVAPWQEPVNMGPTINTRGNEANATFTTDGLEVIFNSGCIGPCSPSPLRRSTRDSLTDEWTTPERIADRGDQIDRAAHPSLSPDGLSLYFNDTGSFGGWDVFVSTRPSLDAPFGPGENVGAPVSTSIRDTGVRVAPDGSLYYGRWSGSLRIWRAEAESIANPFGDFDIYTPHARHTQLGTIDPNTGVGTNIGSFQHDLRLASGAFDNDGQFYSIALLEGNTDSQLARVDTSSGEATLIGSSMGTFAVPLEVSDDGTMYTVGYLWPADDGTNVLGDNTNLFTVNKTDGQLTEVGPTEVTRPMDLAFDSQGTLWLLSGGDDGNHLYTLDQANGEATKVSTINGVVEATESGAELMGIMFDEHDTLFGTAYYAANADFVSPLFNIDPASGMATVIGDTGFVNPHGGDYRHVMPEPTMLPGDANLDGEVGFADFLVLSENFGGSGGWSEGDFDLNGTVEFSDFLLLSDNFGKTSINAAAVPEPNGLIVAWLGLLGLVTFRRHHRSSRR